MAADTPNNMISFVIADAARQACDGAVQTLNTQLKPLLINLTDDQRRTLPRIGATLDVFSDKGLIYGRSNPELLPPFFEIEEVQRDADCVAILTPYRQALFQLVEMIDDTIDRARYERLQAALGVYANSKMGAKLNHPGAATIRDDMGSAFVRYGRHAKVTSPAPAPMSGPAPAPAPEPVPADKK